MSPEAPVRKKVPLEVVFRGPAAAGAVAVALQPVKPAEVPVEVKQADEREQPAAEGAPAERVEKGPEEVMEQDQPEQDLVKSDQ